MAIEDVAKTAADVGGKAAAAAEAASWAPLAASIASLGADAAGATAAGSALAAVGGALASIPGLGWIVGAATVVGVILNEIFSVKPSPEFSRELLAVFRCYPNVLRDWISERESAGIETEASWSRTRWGYIAALREAAGEKGYDIFEDEAWQARFEAKKVKLPRCKRWPDLKKLGFNPTPAELAQALAELRVSLAGLPLVASAIVVKGGLFLTVRETVTPQQLPKAKKRFRQLPTLLYVFKGTIPIYINILPPVTYGAGREAELAAKQLDFTYAGTAWFRDADVIMTPEGAAVRVEVRGDLPPGVTEASLSLVAGQRVILSRSTSTMLWFAGGATAILVGGIAAAVAKNESDA